MGKKKAAGKRDISNYAHTDKQRANNPPVDLGHWTWAVSKETADLPEILGESRCRTDLRRTRPTAPRLNP
jgi:hypothetical protein